MKLFCREWAPVLRSGQTGRVPDIQIELRPSAGNAANLSQFPGTQVHSPANETCVGDFPNFLYFTIRCLVAGSHGRLNQAHPKSNFFPSLYSRAAVLLL